MEKGGRKPLSGATSTHGTLPSGAVTILLTDIRASSRLWEEHPGVMPGVLARHDEILTGCIQRHGGFVVKSQCEGDSVFAVFERSGQGIEAAVAIQREIAAEDWPRGIPLEVRIALHTGDVEQRAGDYFGPTVNRCARLREIAHGGQTLLSQATFALAVDRVPDDVRIRSLGRHRLRSLARSEIVYEAQPAESPTTFPELPSLDAHPNNLPVQLTSLVGRAHELEAVANLIRNNRLVTLSGTGGAGKTRLALQAAVDVLDEFPDGVWFVALEGVESETAVVHAVASASGAVEAPGRNLTDALVSHFAGKSVLVVLDNCEHVVDACAEIASRLLRHADGVRVLATSREVLNVGGEVVWTVSGLRHPPAGTAPAVEKLGDYEAVQLFVERARLRQPDFALDETIAADVARLCRRLDGLPLAIELAAARLDLMSVAEIVRHLGDRFSLLTGGPRTARRRHKTLRDAVDWSYELLEPSDCSVFRRLSSFAGGFTLEAAEAVASSDDVPASRVLDALSDLVDKSMVGAVDDRRGQGRFRLLRTLKEYGRERLAEAGETRLVAKRHAAHFAGVAEEAESQLQGPEQSAWLDRLEDDHDDLRRVLAWPSDHDDVNVGLHITGCIWRFWHMRGHIAEGRAMIGRLLDHCGDACDRAVAAKALRAAGTLAYYQGDITAAHGAFERSMEIARALGDDEGMALTWNNLGLAYEAQSDHAAAREAYEQCLEHLRRSGDDRRRASVLANLGLVARMQGDYASAIEHIDESMAASRRADDEAGVASSLLYRGYVAMDQGEYAPARAALDESLDIRTAIGDPWGEAETLLALGILTRCTGDTSGARALVSRSREIADELGDQWGVADALTELAFAELEADSSREAKALFEQSVAIWRELDNAPALSNALSGLGCCLLREGTSDAARSCLRESLEVRHASQDVKGLADSLEQFAALALANGDPERTLRLGAAAAAHRDRLGAPAVPCEAERCQTCYEEARTMLGDAEASAAWHAGSEMSVEQAVHEALS